MDKAFKDNIDERKRQSLMRTNTQYVTSHLPPTDDSYKNTVLKIGSYKDIVNNTPNPVPRVALDRRLGNTGGRLTPQGFNSLLFDKLEQYPSVEYSPSRSVRFGHAGFHSRYWTSIRTC